MKTPCYLLWAVCLFFFSCHQDEAAALVNYPKPPSGEFSPRDSLQDILIRGRVQNYNPDLHPAAIQLKYQPWHTNSLPVINAFVDSSGHFSFTVRNNVVQNYWFVYGGDYPAFMLRPGDTVDLELYLDADLMYWQVRSLDEADNFMAEGIRMMELVWEQTRSVPPVQSDQQSDVLELKELYLEREVEVRRRVDSVLAVAPIENPYVRSIGLQQVAFQFKRSFLFLPLTMAATRDDRRRDSLAHLAYHPGLNSLPELSAYSGEQLDYFKSLDIKVGAHLNLNNRGMPALDRLHKKRDYIYENYQGLAADLLYSSSLNQAMSYPKDPFYAVAEIEAFIASCPFPMITLPLAERLSDLTEAAKPNDAYAEQLKELPEGVENPIPEILAKHTGKVVVIDFWASWCSPCLKEIRNESPTLIREYAEQDVAFVFLAANTPEAAWKAEIARMDFTAEHYLLNNNQDMVCKKLFNFSGIPHHVVFDRNGELFLNHAAGAGMGLKETIAEALAVK